MMKNLKEFDIPFKGLKDGIHHFEYEINNKFFNFFDYYELKNTNFKVFVEFIKKTNLLELNFSIKGTVTVPCDLTNILFDLKVSGELPLIVKFGLKYNDDDDKVLILPYEEYNINIAQYIYELIILSTPIKRVHPEVLNGIMDNDVLKKLRSFELGKNKFVDKNKSTDPRWDKLKDLQIGKNK